MMIRRSCCCLLMMAVISSVALCDESQSEIADITWKLGPNLPEFRKGGSATILNGKLISVFGMRQPWGEMATMYVYDPRTNWWSRGPDAPFGQTYVQGTEMAGAFYAISGRSRDFGGVHTECRRLQWKNGQFVWDELAQLNVKRAWAPSVALRGKLYVFGGAQGGHGPTLSSVETLDTTVKNSQWKVISKIPGPSRGWLGAAVAGGKIYVIGGSHFFDPKPTNGPDRKRLNELWHFDPQANRWNAMSPLPYRLAGFDCCVYADRYIIITGGAPDEADFTPKMQQEKLKDRFHASYYCPFVLVYDTREDRWQRLPTRLPVPTNDIRVVIDGDTLYAVGGENVEPATSNTTPWLRIGKIVRR